MKILLSIKPEFADKILNGNKQFEFRKVIPKVKVTTVLIYATRPIGKIIGEFEIEYFLSETPNKLWALTSNFSGISENFFYEYFQDCKIAHALKIRKAYRYKKPMELTTILASGVVPQSFCYLK
ncbi:TPA: ASCH domain-containing protein [Legionella pneumophila]|nr:ASCH domain-containing protein [Legionella pneumophila subsp. fraseri]HAT1659749.1 ASCH domain-containing protein [Legionella pneumophila]MDX1846889.1 ASCH domain-containing protein [Legionella pneumophila subsp. fraseri]HAT1771131.1 ASCH domain-containing protein [Legionella pneumophila]HAT2135040.1 ASCH domain-containing protein [Legionella pneumophila]